jgi:peroxiredoxin
MQGESYREHHVGSCVLSSDTFHQFGLVFNIDEAARAVHKQVGADLPKFNGNDSWELPKAGTFLVDQSDTIRLAFVDPDFMRRLDPSVIIARLKELQGERGGPIE